MPKNTGTGPYPVNLMIVGAQKAGTTSLMHYLGQHPGICYHQERDMHYFTNEQEFSAGYTAGFQRYFHGGNGSDAVYLGKSAGLMYMPKAAQRLKDHNESVQIIICLRNPIDRAYSGYWYARRRGLEDKKTFEDAVEVERKRLEEGYEFNRLRVYLEKGKYINHIRYLESIFQEDHIHVYLLNQLIMNPERICGEIFGLFPILDGNYLPKFIEQHNPAARPRSRSLAKILWNRNSLVRVKRLLRSGLRQNQFNRLRTSLEQLNEVDFDPPPMNQKTRQMLIGYYRPYNDKLASYLNFDLGYWNQ